MREGEKEEEARERGRVGKWNRNREGKAGRQRRRGGGWGALPTQHQHPRDWFYTFNSYKQWLSKSFNSVVQTNRDCPVHQETCARAVYLSSISLRHTQELLTTLEAQQPPVKTTRHVGGTSDAAVATEGLGSSSSK